RRDASSGTSTRHCAGCTGRPRRSASATTADRRSRSSGSTRYPMPATAFSASNARKMQSRSNGALFWPVLAAVTAADVVSKGFAERALAPQRIPHDVFGSAVRLTLVYNPGAAFGLHLGDHSRWIFTGLTLVALV